MLPTLEYIAGFFDGEGSIGIYANGRGTAHLRTQLTQNVTEKSTNLMRFLRIMWDGGITTQRTPYGLKYNWQLNSGAAVRFLEKIEPFLILKREQARIGCAWWNSRPRQKRNVKGQFSSVARPIDILVIELMKRLKKADLNSLSKTRKMNGVIKRLTRRVKCATPRESRKF